LFGIVELNFFTKKAENKKEIPIFSFTLQVYLSVWEDWIDIYDF